jgi:DNA-binding SARP family transcriptional activator/ATP/maltotriose-dependent transcriptional regulator MalT
MVSEAALPLHHVPRRRLVQALEGASIGLVEAGGGYGKSVLASEVRRHFSVASAVCELVRDTEAPEQLLGALRRGLRRAGLSDLATAVSASSPEELAATLDRTAEPLLLVVEEVQHARGPAAELLGALARDLDPRHRLLLIGRRLDPRLSQLRELGAAYLDADALAFDDDELRELLLNALGRAPEAAEILEMRRIAAGWPAASVLLAERLPGRAPATSHRPSAALASLLDDLLAPLTDDERERVCRLGYPPLLSEDVASACAVPGALELMLETGLPVRARGPAWTELPDPIRDELAARASLPVEAARATARTYADAGEIDTALALLGRVDDSFGTAQLLAERRWQELAALELAELRAILDNLPSPALARHPFALVQVARLAEQRYEFEYRSEVLTRALELVEDPVERREVEAELAETHASLDPGDSSETEAAAILSAASHDERRTRARALAALGRVGAWRGDPVSMRRAEGQLGEAAALSRLAGEPEWEARTLVGLGYAVAFARGELDVAVKHLKAALALLPEPSSERAGVATFLADVLAYVGRFDEAAAVLDEAAAIGRNLSDDRVIAYAAWTGATVASLRGDRASTIQRIRTVERHPSEWFEHPTGVEFLAAASLALARVGARAEAADYSRRACERAEEVGYPEIAWLAEGAVAARWGDPTVAEERLRLFADSPEQAPRDEWRTLLFRALAAARVSGGTAGELAARAYEAAEELGRPDLPELHEPDVAGVVGPLAVAAGSRAAAARTQSAPAFVITLMGGFGVAADGRPLQPPSGRPSTLVKALALAPATLTTDEAIEVLWPEIDEQTGRQRLRNLLNRLRTSCGSLVHREGETLALATTVEVDARRFEAAAREAVAAREARAGLARAALAQYPGELLPADRYEQWAAAPRERLRRRYLELLELLVDDAVGRGELDEAIRLLERLQEAEPLDEEPYVRAAELLLFQGRRGGARSFVDRAVAVCDELGLKPSERVERLRAAVER